MNLKMEKIWIGRKVFIQIINSTRRYTGVVKDETEDLIIIKDIKNMLVEIPKAGALIQEER